MPGGGDRVQLKTIQCGSSENIRLQMSRKRKGYEKLFFFSGVGILKRESGPGKTYHTCDIIFDFSPISLPGSDSPIHHNEVELWPWRRRQLG